MALSPSQHHKPRPRICVCTKHVYLLAGCCTFRLHACPCGSALVIVELFFFIFISLSLYLWVDGSFAFVNPWRPKPAPQPAGW